MVFSVRFGFVVFTLEQETCRVCNIGHIENEEHFLIHCCKYNEIRHNLLGLSTTLQMSLNGGLSVRHRIEGGSTSDHKYRIHADSVWHVWLRHILHSHCILSICNIYLFPALVLRAGFAF